MREKVIALAGARYGTEAEYCFARFPGFAVLRHPNRKWYGVIMDLPRAKLGLPGEGTVDALNVKCGPAAAGSLRALPGIYPAYHMQKESWVTVLLDGTVALEQVEILLDMSFRLVGSPGKKAPVR